MARHIPDEGIAMGVAAPVNSIGHWSISRTGKSPLRVDGGLIDAFNLPRACWEAKDTKDSLRVEAQKKFALEEMLAQHLLTERIFRRIFLKGRPGIYPRQFGAIFYAGLQPLRYAPLNNLAPFPKRAPRLNPPPHPARFRLLRSKTPQMLRCALEG